MSYNKVKKIFDNELNSLRKLRKQTALKKTITKIEKNKRDFILYYAIQNLEGIKIRILNELEADLEENNNE